VRHLYTWCGILLVVSFSVVGDVTMSRAMKQVGDLHALRQRFGIGTVICRIFSNSTFFVAVAAMAVSFFSLLFSLSWET